MKQKPRKFSNGFHPTGETDLEEMADKERDTFDNQDTVLRLTEIMTDLRSSDKLSAEEKSDVIGVIRDEIESEQFVVRTLHTGVDTVRIYSVSQWSRHKVSKQLEHCKELLAEMETHEEIIKLLTNICELVNKDNKKDEEADDESDLLDEVKQVQTILYQLWLRLLEWECLLEQQQQTPGPLQSEESATDCSEEMLRSPAENVGHSLQRNVESFTTSSSSPSSTTLSPTSSTSTSTSSASCLPCDSPTVKMAEESDSDSGVSDLSSDITFYKSRRVSPPKSTQRSENVKKFRLPVKTKSSTTSTTNTQTLPSKTDSALDCLKWPMLIFLILLLMLTTLVLFHVRCDNSVCALSLERRIHYYKYYSPI